jgi:lathosterol oxidase
MNATAEILSRFFGISTLRYFIIAGAAFLVYYILFKNKVYRSKIQQKIAAKKDFIREILYSIQTNLVFVIIAYLILRTPFKVHTNVYSDLNTYPLWWFFVSIVLSLLIHDTYFYWMHRLLHHPKLFKLTHLVHHRSTNPSPWASYSFHFIEAWTEGGVLLVLVMIMPIHPLAIFSFTIASFFINVYGHLGYEILPKKFRHTFGFEIFNTSVHHNLHHSKFKGNYGLYFRVWDRLMKTEHPDYVKEYDLIQKQRFEH